ncbi:MAG: TonB-dependent receptor [Bacteroidales bacterium]|nr:TonB-dependent receptor [Bacteroidales bacterium]
MKKTLFIVLALMMTTVTWAQHTINGTITDQKTGETLIGATIYDTISKKGATTNQHGRYTLTLKGEKAVLRYSFVGCETQYIKVDLSKDQRIDVKLNSSLMLQEVTITDHRTEHVESSQTSLIEIPVEQVKAVPVLFGETDIIKAVQLLPGVQSGSEGTSGMYVRGGGPDENLFLLDGVPMYNVNHLGGFFSAFNSDAVKNISLYKGSFPAHFSSRLSSVLDITTNNGNDKEYHGGLSVGLISAKFNFEGPIIKEKTTFSISGRRTYGDALLQPILALVTAAEGEGKYRAGYYFYDLNAKVTHKFNDRSRLYASYYMGDDALYAKVQYRFSSVEKDYLKLNYNWGNIVSSLRWNYELTPKMYMNVTGSYTRYRNDLSLGTEFVSPLYMEDYTMSYKSGIQDITGRVDFDYAPTPDHSIKFGGQVMHHIFTPETSSLKMVDSSIYHNEHLDTVIGMSIVHANEVMAYAEDDWRINDWLKVNAGLNFTGFAVQNTFYPSIQPRLSGRILINDRLSAKVGYAYMTQYLHLLSNSNLSLPTDLWVPVTARIKPMNSNQVAAGLFYNLMDSLNLSVEGYYKYMNNLLEYKDGASFWGSSQGWEDKVAMGRGWSYGIEFLAQKTLGRFTGWIGYTWSHTDRKFDRPGNLINDGRVFPAKYDRRHDISIVATYKFSENFDASISWVFSTGNATTLAMQDVDVGDGIVNDYGYYWGNEVGYISNRNNYRMPNYHRLDASLNFHKKLKHGKRTINLSVYNLYNRQNPYMIYSAYDSVWDGRDYVSYKSLRQLSIFPIIPSISYTWKF